MRKIFLLLSLISFLSYSQQKKDWFFGAEFGSNSIISYQSNELNKSFQVGILSEYYFAKQWSVLGRVKYFKTGVSFLNNNNYGKFEGVVLSIPINIKWEFKIYKNLKANIRVGGAYNFETKSEFNFPIQENAMSGPNGFCDTATYSFSDICKIPSTVTWSVSPNLQIVSSTSYSVTVSQISNGQGTITATFQNGQTVTKTVWVGKPIIEDYSNSDFCQGGGQREQNSIQIGSDFGNFEWRICEDPTLKHCLNDTGVFIIGNENRAKVYFDVPAMATYIPIFVRAQNDCGWSEWLNVSRYAQSCNKTDPACGQCYKTASVYKIYPNPSKDIVNIDLRDLNDIPVIKTRIFGELFDLMGQSKSKVEILNNKAVFSVKGLNKGIYVLKIYIKDKIESHQIMVE